MFQLVSGTISAVQQLAAMLAALVCWGIGALLVGDALYWARHAVRVSGEVVGVRQRGNCLNAVYRYVSPSGETCEATSLQGSDSSQGKATGMLVPLLVMPGRPGEVQEARSHVFTIVGIALLAVGAVIFWMAVRSWRSGPMTWVVAAAFLVHIGHRAWSVFFPPGDKAVKPPGWREMLARRAVAAVPDVPVQRLEDLTARPAYQARVSVQRANARRLAPFMLAAGLGLFWLGVHQSQALIRLQASGLRTAGTVTELSRSNSSNGGSTYYPVVSYTTRDGKRIVFRDSTGSSPPMYHVGEAVTVLYPPGAGSGAIIDRGIWNWLPAALIYLFGTLLTVFSLGILRRSDPPVTSAG
jgi:Protein of unknown function (DUF3592)